jgi:hypothetical protein
LSLVKNSPTNDSSRAATKSDIRHAGHHGLRFPLARLPVHQRLQGSNTPNRGQPDLPLKEIVEIEKKR